MLVESLAKLFAALDISVSTTGFTTLTMVMMIVMVMMMVMVKLPSTGRSGRTSCNVEKVLFKKFTSEQINFIVYKSSYAQFLEQIFSAIYWGW